MAKSWADVRLPIDTRIETEHRWFEYGRWFYGYGSSMEGHSCARHAAEGGICETRTVTTTVTKTEGDWEPWSPDHG